MTDFYADIAEIALDTAADFTVGGPSWSITRPSGDGITADVTVASAGTVTAYIVPNAQNRTEQTLTGVGVYDSDWLVFARASVTLVAGDILSDDTNAFILTGAPNTTLGFLIAPAELTTMPDTGDLSLTVPGAWIGIGRIPTYSEAL